MTDARLLRLAWFFALPLTCEGIGAGENGTDHCKGMEGWIRFSNNPEKRVGAALWPTLV